MAMVLCKLYFWPESKGFKYVRSGPVDWKWIEDA